MNALRVGIVGGAGQVGFALLKALSSDRRLTPFGICRNALSAARVASQGMQVRIAQTDNTAQLLEATGDLDVLVNCALPQYGPSKTSVANKRLADSLVNASEGKHLVHLSSVAVYGDFISNRRALFDDPKPNTGYGRQKLQMESLLRRLAKTHPIKCTILRVGHVYGAGLRWSELLFDLIKSEGFQLPFDGQLSSNAISITNLIAGITDVLVSGPRGITINITDAPQTPWRDIFDLHSQAGTNALVEALSKSESERCLRESKKSAQIGTTARLTRETWRWMRHLPSSFVAAVPAFKEISRRLVEKLGSERLEAKLWAVYYRRFAREIGVNTLPVIHPLFMSEPVPGPSLSYEACSITGGFAALQEWHDAISDPLLSNVFSKATTQRSGHL